MGRTIIAISGWAKSGKDTLANFLIKEKNAKRLAFADSLKEMVAAQYNIPLEWTHDQLKKEIPLRGMPVEPKDSFSKMIAKFMYKEFRTWTGQTPSGYCFFDHDLGHITPDGIFYGIAKGEKLKLFWTPRALCILEGSVKRTANSEYWVKKAIEKADKNGLFVISDLRYQSEIYSIKTSMSEEDTLVTVRVNRFEKTQSNDPSERDLDNAEFDHVIKNDGTLEEYMLKINNMLKERGL
jgi:hypothetical protein